MAVSFKEFLIRANKAHNFKYDYSKTIYTVLVNKIIIICPIHGEFEQIAKNHLKKHGCRKCGIKTQINNVRLNNDFLTKALKIHKNKYNYEKSEYIKNTEKICIICPLHGEFWQTPANHLHKTHPQGCYKCGKKRVSLFQRQNPNGWTLTNWIESANKSKNFDGFKCYIVKCKNENEEFYKIGRTFKTIKGRFLNRSANYKIEVIKIFYGTGKEIYKMEAKFKKLNKKYKYIPKIKFDGMHECYFKLSQY